MPTARERAMAFIQSISGSKPKSLDRAFVQISLQTPGKDSKVLSRGSAWLSRNTHGNQHQGRFALRQEKDAVQLSFVNENEVLRGPAKGPFAPAEEKEARRMQELNLLLQTLLCWDLLDPRIQLSLPAPDRLRSQGPASKDRPGHRIERGVGKDRKKPTLTIDGKDYRLEGSIGGPVGSLPRRVLLPESGQILEIEAWLTGAEFKTGFLDPTQSTDQSQTLVVGREPENAKPMLREFGPVWEIAIQDPEDWASRVRILTQEVPPPFMQAGLSSAGLPTLTSNGKILIHVRSADGKTRPRAPKGYRLEHRASRVSAVVYVTCSWAQSKKALRKKLEPYIKKLGLRARGPLWMSPYLDWATASEGPGAKDRIKIRGEIRVR